MSLSKCHKLQITLSLLHLVWLWTTLAITNSMNSHSGYHFPFFPSPEAHDFHHLKFNQCYGVLGILDYLHGTDIQFRESKVTIYQALGCILQSVKHVVSILVYIFRIFCFQAYQRHILSVSSTPLRDTFPDDESSKVPKKDKDMNLDRF